MKTILFVDLAHPTAGPLSRFGSIFSKRNGIYSPFERIAKIEPGIEFHFLHPSALYESLLCKVEGLISFRSNHSAALAEAVLKDPASISNQFDLVMTSDAYDPAKIVTKLPETIKFDAPLWLRLNPNLNEDWEGDGIHTIGSKADVHIHEAAEIFPGTIFNTEDGPVIIDEGAKVGQFSYLEGPLYVGKFSHIDNARLTGGCVIGSTCRIGGEVEASVINDYSNKHHEGFIGHSLLGNWVNIGAIATTSDLKNNYGFIRLEAPADLYKSATELEVIDTNTIKFGSIIGDCCKVGIGTMLNTGTVLDAGSNVFGASPRKYQPAFSWGVDGARYDLDKFKADFTKIAARRKVELSEELMTLIDMTYECAVG